MSKNKFLSLIPLAIAFSGLFYSCRESCNCSTNDGCVILTATDYATSALKEQKMYCSESNYYTSKILSDSVQAFYRRHDLNTTNVQRRDSIYSTYVVKDLKREETERYSNVGFQCQCAK